MIAGATPLTITTIAAPLGAIVVIVELRETGFIPG